MTDKTLSLIISGWQVVLGAIMLLLVSVGIVAHLVSGHLGFIGIIVAAVMWYIIFRLFAMSVADFKADKAMPDEYFEQDFEDEED